MADERTIEELAREALVIQDACNLSGLVLGFGRAVQRLRVLLEAEGKASTPSVNRHPICVLWVDKLQSLTGTGFSAAYDWAQNAATPAVPDWVFRSLEPAERERFQAWARANYTPGSEIQAAWHPAVREECERMNREASEASETAAE